MKKILITGATGNIGSEVIRHLAMDQNDVVRAGLRSPLTEKLDAVVESVKFDFYDLDTVAAAIEGIDTVFLLRPPQIADVKGVFKPIIDLFKEKEIKHIVFLSVQGVEKQSFIPHHKIEKLIVESTINHTFLRPSYFLQNLTTTLAFDIQHNNRIFIPAGKARFNWIDAADIGRVAALILSDPEKHINAKYTLTGTENKSFLEVVNMINELTPANLEYVSPNLLRFFITKRKQGLKPGMIFVMIILHWFQRFGKEPERTVTFQELTGKEPNRLEAFVKRNSDFFT